jgi:Secretion system C-terminal sorting domain
MKKILLALFIGLNLAAPSKIKAQSFTVAHDTVWATVNSYAAVNDNITNHTAGNLTLSWHVIASDFTPSWLAPAVFGACDNHNCYSGVSVWTGSSGSTFSSTYYANAIHDSTDAFDLTINYSSVGSHYMTILVTDGTITKTMTFMINQIIPTSVSAVASAENSVVLYPNPANNEINVVYDANADVKNIAVYNIIGKLMTVYKVSGNSANLNLENTPGGIYFARLVNSEGQVVATRKFTKQ